MFAWVGTGVWVLQLEEGDEWDRYNQLPVTEDVRVSLREILTRTDCCVGNLMTGLLTSLAVRGTYSKSHRLWRDVVCESPRSSCG